MPNWVFNTLVVSGDKVSLDKFREQLNQPYTKHFPDHKWNEETKAWEYTPAIQTYSNPVFAFWNVVKPTDLEAYYGEETAKDVDLDNFVESFNRAVEKGTSWYYWNLRNWGTKWDVGVQDGEQYSSTYLEETDDGSLLYKFETAWSPVLEVIDKLVQMYPNLQFDYGYEEEQGWGGEHIWVNGELTHSLEWDIPQSHFDYEKMDRECPCEYADIDWAFKDCPVDTNQYEWDEDKMQWVEKQGVEA